MLHLWVRPSLPAADPRHKVIALAWCGGILRVSVVTAAYILWLVMWASALGFLDKEEELSCVSHSWQTPAGCVGDSPKTQSSALGSSGQTQTMNRKHCLRPEALLSSRKTFLISCDEISLGLVCSSGMMDFFICPTRPGLSKGHLQMLCQGRGRTLLSASVLFIQKCARGSGKTDSKSLHK